MAPTVHGAMDQARPLEHLHVLGDRRERHGERRGELADRGLSLGEASQDGPAGRVGQGGEDLVDRARVRPLKQNHVV